MGKLKDMQIGEKKESKAGNFLVIGIGLAVIALIVVSVFFFFQQSSTGDNTATFGNQVPSDPASLEGLDKFAYCVAQSNIVMYGAYWCPHCSDQKALFGNAFKYTKYQECSPNGRGTPQAAVCTQKSVQSYPTWIDEDTGQRFDGVQSLQQLAAASGCTLEA